MAPRASGEETSLSPSHQATESNSPRGCGRMLPRLAVGCFFLLIAFLFRAFWLPVVAYPLMAPAPQHENAVTLIWARSSDGKTPSGDGIVERTASLLKTHPHARVIFTQGWSSRLVELGVIPPPYETFRSALAKYQIESERVINLEVNGFEFWNEAKAVDAFLREHPEERVLLLVEEFAGQSHRYVLRRALDVSHRDRVEILGLPDLQYSYHDWWRSRSGVKGVMVGYLFLIHTILQPQPLRPPRKLSLEDFEQSIPEAPGGRP